MTLRITLLVLVTGLFAVIWTQDQPASQLTDSPTPALAQHTDVPVPRLTEKEVSLERKESQEGAKPRRIVPESLEKANRRFMADGQRSDQQLGWAGPSWLENEIARYSRQVKQWANEIRNREAAESQVAPVSVIPASANETWSLGDAEMPWPAGLVPGEYRAVSNTGIVRNLTVTLAELQARHDGQAEFVTREVYQSQGKTLRWYFIRVQSDSEESFPAMAERGRNMICPAVAEREAHTPLPAIAGTGQADQLRKQASQLIVRSGQRILQKMAIVVRTGYRPGGILDSLREKTHPAKMSAEEAGKNRL